MIDVAQHLSRFGEQRGIRSRYEKVWRECYDLSYPLRGSGLQGEIDPVTKLDKRPRILDNTATESVRLLASSLMSGETPSSTNWIELSVQDFDADSNVGRWLSAASKKLWELIHAGNFDAEAYEANLDWCVAGWFALYVERKDDGSGITCHQWPIAEIFVDSSDGESTDIIYRCYKLTAAQALNEFGEDDTKGEDYKGVSEKVKVMAEKKPSTPVEILHCIYKRKESKEGSQLAKHMQWASIYIETQTKKIVKESGYHTMPVIVPRAMSIPGCRYGLGPLHDALPEVKRLNELKRLELAAADIAVSGMYVAVDDGVLNPRNIVIGARRVIVANDVDNIKPLNSGSNFQLSELLVDRMQAAIRKIMLTDQLQPQDGPARTATEVHIRTDLIRQLLGPIFGRRKNEFLAPLISRSFDIAYRDGHMGEAPEELQGREIVVSYNSPLSRAQKLSDVTAIERLYTSLTAVYNIDQEIMDNIDNDKTITILSEALGAPAKILRTADEVDAIRANRAKQKQDMAQQQQAQLAAQQPQPNAQAAL